jgi:hypothetical protein
VHLAGDPFLDNLDFGERQAWALAKEIHANYDLLDDKVARPFAGSKALKVKGTLGIVADAAQTGLLNVRTMVDTLQPSSMHLDPQLSGRIIAGYQRGLAKGKGGQWPFISGAPMLWVPHFLEITVKPGLLHCLLSSGSLR